jgi:hypothetical protein
MSTMIFVLCDGEDLKSPVVGCTTEYADAVWFQEQEPEFHYYETLQLNDNSWKDWYTEGEG